MLKDEFNLGIQSLPFDVETYPISFIWHKKNDSDTGLIWLKEEIRKIVV